MKYRLDFLTNSSSITYIIDGDNFNISYDGGTYLLSGISREYPSKLSIWE